MGSSDKIVGASAVAAAMVIFTYYSIWTFVIPFLDESNCIQSLFLPREFAIYLPAAVLVAGISLVTAFFLKVTSKSKNKQKAK